LKVFAAVGVPLIFILLFDQVAVIPVGKPVAVPIPVAPVVVAIIIGSSGIMVAFKFNVGCGDAAIAVLSVQGVTGVTVTMGGETPTALSATTEKV
jgi:hypothetical protein